MGPSAAPGDVADRLDGGRIAHVQVFEDEHHGLLTAEDLQRLRQLSQHAGPRGPGEAGGERLDLRRAQERRELSEPGRRVPTEDFPRHTALGPAAHLVQRLDHGQVCLALAVLLHALSPTDDRAPQRAHEPLDERGLADPRIAGQEHDLSLAL